jgi:hypothetical protein
MRAARPLPVSLVVIGLAIAIAGCGDQTSSASASAVPASAVASAATSTPASIEPSTEASADGEGSAALDCDALEELMPTSIGESTIATICLSGEEIVQAGGSIPLNELEDAGVELEDAAVAIGSGSDGSSGVFMYSLPGADTEAFRDQMANGLEQSLSGSFSRESIGGKEVLKGEGQADVPANYYLYVADDLLVWVLSPNDDVAAEVLADLP